MNADLYDKFYDPNVEFRKEPRAFCYDLAINLIETAKQQKPANWYVHERTIEGILLLLFCWNFAARATKALTKTKIRNLIKECESDLRFLEKHTIMDLDKDCYPKIKKVFGSFKGICGQTGASKALSLLNQRLFIMWDTEIRNYLRKNYIDGIGNGERPEYYLRFLLGMKAIIEKYSLCNKIQDPSSIAKKIDEYHYVELVM